jgi:hypothetical protein
MQKAAATSAAFFLVEKIFAARRSTKACSLMKQCPAARWDGEKPNCTSHYTCIWSRRASPQEPSNCPPVVQIVAGREAREICPPSSRD